MQTSVNWRALINQQAGERRSWLDARHALQRGQLKLVEKADTLSSCLFSGVTSSLPSFDMVWIMGVWALDVAAGTAQVCKASSKDLSNALAVWPPELQ